MRPGRWRRFKRRQKTRRLWIRQQIPHCHLKAALPIQKHPIRTPAARRPLHLHRTTPVQQRSLHQHRLAPAPQQPPHRRRTAPALQHSLPQHCLIPAPQRTLHRRYRAPAPQQPLHRHRMAPAPQQHPYQNCPALAQLQTLQPLLRSQPLLQHQPPAAKPVHLHLTTAAHPAPSPTPNCTACRISASSAAPPARTNCLSAPAGWAIRRWRSPTNALSPASCERAMPRAITPCR